MIFFSYLSYPTSPVFKRIGLGAWQAFCSWEGFFNNPETKSQNGLDVFEPCLKSKYPGPSVVPAAKLKGRDYNIYHAITNSQKIGRLWLIWISWISLLELGNHFELKEIVRPSFNCPSYAKKPHEISSPNIDSPRNKSNFSLEGQNTEISQN